MNASAENPVFIVGLGRSGTTLTRALINDHPEFAVVSELHFLNHWMPKFRRLDIAHSFDVFWDAFAAGKHYAALHVDAAEARAAILADGPPTWRGIYRTLLIENALHVGRRRWGEKTPIYFRHIAQLLEWFPGASIVYLLRDPRGVAASHKTVGTQWADLDPGHVATRWLESVRILESWKGEPRVRGVRYEDIVTAPAATLTDLFGFLGEEFRPEGLERRSSGERPRENGSISTAAAVSPAHVETWRERLSSRDVAMVEHIAGRVMKTYGYEPVSTDTGALTQKQLQATRALRTVARATRALKQPKVAAYQLSDRIRSRATAHR